MIKINDRVKGTTFTTKAIWKKDHYWHIGIVPELASVYGIKDINKIKDVKCTIIEDDVEVNKLYADKNYDIKSIDYFGWVRYNDEDKFWNISLIYPSLTVYHICFPYGADVTRYYNEDVHDIYNYSKILHHKGDRYAYNVRLKIEEL